MTAPSMRAAFDDAEEFPRPSRIEPLRYEWAGQVEPVLDGLWLIDDWLPKFGIAAIYGHSGSGKSFLTMDMALHVAKGEAWAGRHVEHGMVLYVVAEGQTGFRNRLAAYRATHGLEADTPFAFIPTAIDMQAPNGDTDQVIETIRQAASFAGVAPAMIVFDTLAKTFGAGKENTDDMAIYLANCQRVANQFECLSVIVHHRPKDSESRDLRGHSSLRAGIDTAILIEAGTVKTATTIKQKDGEDNQIVLFELQSVVLGEDSRGKEITSCLVEISAPGASAPTMILDPLTKAKRGLKGHAKTALRLIEEVAHQCGENPPNDIPGDKIDRWKTVRAVKAGQVRDSLKTELGGLVDGEGDKKRDTIKRTINRTLEALKSAGILGSWGEWLWIN